MPTQYTFRGTYTPGMGSATGARGSSNTYKNITPLKQRTYGFNNQGPLPNGWVRVVDPDGDVFYARPNGSVEPQWVRPSARRSRRNRRSTRRNRRNRRNTRRN
jgi:hypothetical protein